MVEYLWNICGCFLVEPVYSSCRWHCFTVSQVAPPDRQICGLKLIGNQSMETIWKPYGSHMDMFHKYGQQLRFGLQRESLVSGWDLRVPSFATDKTIRKLGGRLSGFSGWRQNMEIMNGAVLEQERQTGYRWPPAHCSLMEPCMEACKTMSWKAETRGTVALPSHPLSLSSQDISSWMTL